jgi:hypothetical protein
MRNIELGVDVGGRSVLMPEQSCLRRYGVKKSLPINWKQSRIDLADSSLRDSSS